MTAGVVYRPADQNFYLFTDANNRLSTRTMKRRLKADDGMEPQRKRPVYEEHMSRKLLNFHINDNNGGNNNAVQPFVSNSVEELEDWRIDDFELAETTPPIIEECVFDENGNNDESSIVLCNELKSYIDSYKNMNELAFLKTKKTGRELVLYNASRFNNNSNEANDIGNRIFELEDWAEDETTDCGLNTGATQTCTQVVSFPDDSSASSSASASPRNLESSSSSSSNLSMFLSPEQSKINNTPLGAPSLMMSNLEAENDMDID